jgi:type VI secretion system protein ImpE
MGAADVLGGGSLAQALEQAQQQVRQQPADSKHRIFLFQLYCVLGEWQKALSQLDVLREMDAETLPMVQTYQEAIRCEALRGQVFAGERAPLVFGQPEAWLALLLQALERAAAGRFDEAARLRDEAFASAPATRGRIDGEGFEWIADADPRLGPILEAVIDGRYFWVPFHRITSIQVDPPADLRDLVWMPAYFTWANGGKTVGLIPTRYAGSEASPDAQVRLARRTDWREPSPGMYFGQGQRMFATETAEYPLMDVRRVELSTAGEGVPTDTSEGAQGPVSGSD